MKTIRIKQETKIPGTNYVLESGDVIGVQEEKNMKRKRKPQKMKEITGGDVIRGNDKRIQVIRGFLEAAIFTSEEIELDASEGYGIIDFTDEAVQEAAELVDTFLMKTNHIFSRDILNDLGMDWEQVGHDLWMTLTNQGVGFWENEWGTIGDEITDIIENLPYHYEIVFATEEGLFIESKRKRRNLKMERAQKKRKRRK